MKTLLRSAAVVLGLSFTTFAQAQLSGCDHFPASPASSTAKAITIGNPGANTGILYWSDFNARPQYMGEIPPRGSKNVNSFVGHYFFLMTFEGFCLGHWVVQ